MGTPELLSDFDKIISSLRNDSVNLEEASSPLRRRTGEQRRVANKLSAARFTGAVQTLEISDSPG
jgi:hypothetical protein